MLHVNIILVGFLSLALFAIWVFRMAKESGNTIEEMVTATAFGMAVFGILSAIYIGVNFSVRPQNVIWVGVSWLSIINGFLSCIYVKRAIKRVES